MPVSISIKIEGLKELRDSFAKSPQIVAPELEKATKNAGKAVLGRAKKEAPIKTGALRRSIEMDYQPIVATIVPNVKYAIFVHEGSRPHEIRARRAKALRFKARSGKIVYTKKVNHPGYKGNPFMQRTADGISGEVNKIFSKALENITNKLTK